MHLETAIGDPVQVINLTKRKRMTKLLYKTGTDFPKKQLGHIPSFPVQRGLETN